MNCASYTNFYQLSKARVNKFLHLSGWQLGHIIQDATEKSKNDWVTIFDIQISQIIEELIHELKLPFKLLSEETWKNEAEEGHFDLNQPLIVLDPIDGTDGFRKGTKYFCLSLAFMDQGELLSSWLWNFGTQEEIQLTDVLAKKELLLPVQNKPLLGFVSDSEWKKQLWQIESNQIELKAYGSIAYKLLLLAEGKCDFVASKQPKNLWDIAGGSHVLAAKGFKLYCDEKEVLKFNQMHWKAPLLWCLPQDAKMLHQTLFGIL